MRRNSGRLIWSPASKEDLRKIWNYYAHVASRNIADNLLRNIERAGERAADNPLQWRLRMDIWPGLSGGLRSMSAHPYTIFYQLDQDDLRYPMSGSYKVRGRDQIIRRPAIGLRII